MTRSQKVELFEKIRKDYEIGNQSIRGIAQKYQIHRRMVRQAINSALPPARKKVVKIEPKIGQVKELINEILEIDKKIPRKQRHTARRIHQRLEEEGYKIGESTIRGYVKQRKEEMGLAKREIFVPQSYNYGEQAQIDWYEAIVEIEGEEKKVEVFSMRSMASAGAFHKAYTNATQQAFLEAHQEGFRYFGGVFRVCRYDNLALAVKKVLRGNNREQNTRFIAFRSHWQFEAEFCRVGKVGAHEKGGVEGEIGYFRRKHFVPIPKVKSLAQLNEQLFEACQKEQSRQVGDRKVNVETAMKIEEKYLLALASTDFDLTEESFAIVDQKSCVKVRNCFYSVPTRAGMKVQVRVSSSKVEIYQNGQVIAQHERSYEKGIEILNLEHYLDVLERKPGAFAGSKPLKQWKEKGFWIDEYDQIWELLKKRLGKQASTKAMIELLQYGKEKGYQYLQQAVKEALELGCSDLAAIKHLMNAKNLVHPTSPIINVGLLSRYERPLPQVKNYDRLLEVGQ